MVPVVQVRVWDPGAPEMEQPGTAVAMDHTTPEPAGPAGSGSDMTTPVAVPEELLLTVTVKSMLVPAETLGASVVFKMVRTTAVSAVVALEVTVAAFRRGVLTNSSSAPFPATDLRRHQRHPEFERSQWHPSRPPRAGGGRSRQLRSGQDRPRPVGTASRCGGSGLSSRPRPRRRHRARPSRLRSPGGRRPLSDPLLHRRTGPVRLRLWNPSRTPGTGGATLPGRAEGRPVRLRALRLLPTGSVPGPPRRAPRPGRCNHAPLPGISNSWHGTSGGAEWATATRRLEACPPIHRLSSSTTATADSAPPRPPGWRPDGRIPPQSRCAPGNSLARLASNGSVSPSTTSPGPRGG